MASDPSPPRSRRRRRALVAGSAIALVALAGALAFANSSAPGPHLEVADLVEPSGLVPSGTSPGRLWSHNDSGGEPRLFALTRAGRGVATFDVEGAKAIDWEAITHDRAGHLWVGDIGNNANTRDDLAVLKVAEPALPSAPGTTLRVSATVRFRYPEQRARPDPADLNYDAEALFVGPSNVLGAEGAPGRTLFLLTKHRSDTRTALYRFDSLDDNTAGAPLALTRVSAFDVGLGPRGKGMVTDAALSPDEEHLAVLTYHALFIFRRPPPADGDDWLAHLANRVPFAFEHTRQIEAVAWDNEGIVMCNEEGRLFTLDDPLAPRAEPFPAAPRTEPRAGKKARKKAEKAARKAAKKARQAR